MNPPFIHSSAVIDDDVELGMGSKVWHFCHILKAVRIGRNCVLGQNVMVGPDVIVGDGCKIQNNVSLFRGVRLEENVFCGPSAVFTNVLTPRAFINRRSDFMPTLVQYGASIGANATIICGVKIGRFSMVGAGAVVTRDVTDHALVVGNPAKQIGWVSCSGDRLGKELKCPRTGERYQKVNGKLVKSE